MWFTEDPWPPMLICGLGALLAISWWANSKRGLAAGLAVFCLALGGAVYVVEGIIVTPAEEVEQLVTDLCWQFQRRDPKVLEHFSQTAASLRHQCQAAMLLVEVQPDLRLTDFQTRLTNEGSRAICHFRANATISVLGAGNVGRQPSRFELTWAREGDAWKIIDLRRLNPIRDEELGLMDRSPQ